MKRKINIPAFPKKEKVHTSQVSIPKFWYEVGDGFCFQLQLKKSLKSIFTRYKFKLGHVNEANQLLSSEWDFIEFVGVVIRTNGFKDLKIKVEDPAVIYFLTSMKVKEIEQTGVEMRDI